LQFADFLEIAGLESDDFGLWDEAESFADEAVEPSAWDGHAEGEAGTIEGFPVVELGHGIVPLRSVTLKGGLAVDFGLEHAAQILDGLPVHNFSMLQCKKIGGRRRILRSRAQHPSSRTVPMVLL